VPVDREIVVERTGATSDAVPRARRPAVRRFLWAASSPTAHALSLSSRLLAPTVPELRARQALLDVRSFGVAVDPMERWLERQSSIASALGDLVAGDSPEAF